MVGEGEFLEWASVVGHRSGTPRAPLVREMRLGRTCVLEIDVQGARQVREEVPDAILIFLAPPSIDELERRLRGRGTEDEQRIRRRMETATWEMEQTPFDGCVFHVGYREAGGRKQRPTIAVVDYDDVPKKEAAVLKAAIPEAERFDARDVLLGDAMVKRIEKLARARVKERLVTFYTASKDGATLGYAVIHSHVVRTKRETFAIAFEPDGRIRKISILAFLEPEEYRPSERWLRQFDGKGAQDRLAVGDDIAPISGATLSARGIAEESRWLLQALRDAAGVKP